MTRQGGEKCGLSSFLWAGNVWLPLQGREASGVPLRNASAGLLRAWRALGQHDGICRCARGTEEQAGRPAPSGPAQVMPSAATAHPPALAGVRDDARSTASEPLNSTAGGSVIRVPAWPLSAKAAAAADFFRLFLTPTGLRLCIAARSVSVVPDGTTLGNERFGEPRYPINYSITSSARSSNPGGISSLISLAVLRLMANSIFTDCCTGRSAGFSPFRMRPV
jgi:hypothetical protein